MKEDNLILIYGWKKNLPGRVILNSDVFLVM